MPELNKSNSLLAFCSTERTYGQIKSEFGLADGAIYSMLQRLVARGLLSKVREGVYGTSPKGIEYLKEKTGEIARSEANKINHIISIVVANKIGRNKHEFVDTVKLVKNVFFADPATMPIRNRIKKIYEDAVIDNDNSSDLIRTMWTVHNKVRCKNHFDFLAAYDKHMKNDDKTSNDIKRYWTRDQLFEALHFCSLPTVERVRRNLRAGR